MRLQTSLTFLVTAASLLLGATAADSNDICKICECNAENKTIDCEGRGLSHQFPNASSWTALTVQPTRLDFHHNLLVHIHPFPSLPSLERLNLQANRISRIDPKAFLNLTSLRVLDLSKNELTTEYLKAAIFEGHYAPENYEPIGLTSLDLSYNALHALAEGVFQHLPRLEVLSLRGNPLRVIDRGTLMALSGLDRLRVLDLQSTQISALPEYMLHRPLHLENLDLSFNAFTAPPPGLSDTHGLKRLDFSGNNLETLTSFPPIANLETLIIDNCENLTTIEKGALSNLTTLTTLSISKNHRLTFVHEDALAREDADDKKTWPNITKLYLSENALAELPAELLQRWNVLQDLNIDGNPLACECNNQWIITILIPMMDKKIPQFGYGLKCASPPELARQAVRSMARFHHLRCADLYGNRPERDTAMLIGVLIGVLIAVPVTAALIMIWKRGLPLLGRRTVIKESQRAFYKRVESESDNVNMHI